MLHLFVYSIVSFILYAFRIRYSIRPQLAISSVLNIIQRYSIIFSIIGVKNGHIISDIYGIQRNRVINQRCDFFVGIPHMNIKNPTQKNRPKKPYIIDVQVNIIVSSAHTFDTMLYSEQFSFIRLKKRLIKPLKIRQHIVNIYMLIFCFLFVMNSFSVRARQRHDNPEIKLQQR